MDWEELLLLAGVAGVVVLATTSAGGSSVSLDGGDSSTGDSSLMGLEDMSKSVNLPSDVDTLIQQAATKYGVPVNLARAQAMAESGGNQDVVSGAGAIGVFQLMPSTAAGLGVDPNDVTQNVDGGVKYLSQLLKRYNGDQTLALAAYNAGMGNVAKYGGVPPFAETQNYISKILDWVQQLAS
jgi:soluble lytic murein transglycosylase-like protein